MPGLWAHSFYWSGGAASGNPPDPPLGASASGGYVPWQTSIITAMSLGLICRISLAPMR